MPAFSTRDQIIQVVNRMAFSVDTCNWSAARACFADRVQTDYTSLIGGEPAEIPADDLIAGWRSAIEPLTSMQHLVGSHVVDIDGERASCTAQVVATHAHRAGHGSDAKLELWQCAGAYRYELTLVSGAWLIESATFTLGWETGDREVMKRAAAAFS